MDNKSYINMGPKSVAILESDFTDTVSKYDNDTELMVIADDYSNTNGFYVSVNNHWVKYKK